jgi:uncharacterized FlaG/YvyC family protein
MNSEISKISAGQLIPSQDKPDLKLIDKADNRETRKVGPVEALEVEKLGPADLAEKLNESVSQLKDFVTSVQRDLRFSVDELSGRTVITVLDSKTDKIIRQIPSEEVLAFAQNIDSLKGALFSAKV